MNTRAHPLVFLPNIRRAKAHETSGYLWGKPAKISEILKHLPEKERSLYMETLEQRDIISERWMCSDDPELGSTVLIDGKPHSFRRLLDQEAVSILGPNHVEHFGPYLGCIMKQLDTNDLADKGGLSVQVHPATGHPARPTKPEMWKGHGSVYLGWKEDMDAEKIAEAYQNAGNGGIERLMNTVTLREEDLVLVHGGLIHAIRAGSFLAEWSKAPHAEDIAKGNLAQATVALWDRTDGKSPRPGKEDLQGTLEVMEHAGSFKKSSIEELLTAPRMVWQDQDGNLLRKIFQTPEVHVDEMHITSNMPLSLRDGGLPLFVERGEVEVWQNNEPLIELPQGSECFLPYTLESVILKNNNAEKAIIQTWYAPIDTTGRRL